MTLTPVAVRIDRFVPVFIMDASHCKLVHARDQA
jgi:hypothetical protein